MVGAISEMALEAMDMGDGTHRTGSSAQNKGNTKTKMTTALTPPRNDRGGEGGTEPSVLLLTYYNTFVINVEL